MLLQCPAETHACKRARAFAVLAAAASVGPFGQNVTMIAHEIQHGEPLSLPGQVLLQGLEMPRLHLQIQRSR